MSTHKRNYEVASTARLWSQNYEPVHPFYLETWREDWISALRRLNYVHGIRAVDTGNPRCQIEVRGVYHFLDDFEDCVEADLTQLWDRFLAKGLRSLHSTERDGAKVIFSFACREEDGSYVTGRVVLVRREIMPTPQRQAA